MSGFIENPPVVCFDGLGLLGSLFALRSRLVYECLVRGLASRKLLLCASQIVGGQLPSTKGHKVRSDQERDNESRRG